ncbi:MAG: protein translocase subunit SecD [Burkholderiaceae bacterium]
MNRYPIWKYVVMVAALVFGLLYTLPNFFGDAPALQVSSAKVTVKIDDSMLDRVDQALSAANITPDKLSYDGKAVRARFADTDIQTKAQEVVSKAINPDPDDQNWVVALNLTSNSPDWLTAINALPMYLGLDLRGGIHFLMQVDMTEALQKRLESTSNELRTELRERKIRHKGVDRVNDEIQAKFETTEIRDEAVRALAPTQPRMLLKEADIEGSPGFTAAFTTEMADEVRQTAIQQNITTLSNRVNELGVSEPVIQRQGADRIIVQLPGVQDSARAKAIIGRIATLEIRMVCEEPDELTAFAAGRVPLGCQKFKERRGTEILLRKQINLTGENLNDAQAGFDSQTNEPAVHLTLDSKGARIFKNVTRRNVGKRMAIALFEKGKGEVITAPVIRTEIGGGRVQISGAMTTPEAADLALLLRAGSLAAPMEIIEERTIGPSLGKENIQKGFNSVLWGFIALAVGILIYYMIFGMFSVIALAFNLTLLIAVLSLMQATLTLPGIAAIALTLGMAIDANVLINERIREELRAGNSPQRAITEGYNRAWDTILDSNITTLIAGVALLAFGSGPVRGFAVVHCIGILTSMFSAVFFSRGLVNFWYGRQKKIDELAIGLSRKFDEPGAKKKVKGGKPA